MERSVEAGTGMALVGDLLAGHRVKLLRLSRRPPR